MRLIRILIAVIFVTLTSARIQAEQGDFNDISAYYGFGEIEIIKLDWGIQNLRIADFNGDGKKDIAIANNIKTRIELLIQKAAIGLPEEAVAVDPNDADINMLTPPTRFDRQSVPVSQHVTSFVCGDLNSDGMADLAYYGDPRGLYVIYQKAGESEPNKPGKLSWQTRKKIKIDDGLLTPSVLVCGDLNNDGKSDLAIAGSECVYVVLQKQDATLAEPVKYPSLSQILGLEIGELNGDGVNDLVIVTNDADKPLQVRFGFKTGQLGPQVLYFIEAPYALKLQKIDGQQAGEDVLTVDGRSGRLICYKLSSSTGKDDEWPVYFYPLASGEEHTRRDLVSGDFDGDGLADVVISDPGAAELIFYKQVNGLGLAEPVKFPTLSGIESLSSSDIDGDKIPEIGVLSIAEKAIGICKFSSERLSFPQPIDIIGDPLAMELADMDQSGKTDCVYVSKDANEVRTFRIIYDFGVPAKEQETSKNAKNKTKEKKDSSSQLVAGLQLGKLAANPDGLKVVDVDQDGLEDVLIFVKYESPILVHQIQKGVFEVVDSPKAQTSLIKDASLSSIFEADVDGKSGKELLIAQNNFARSLVFGSGQSWSVVDQYNAKGTENKISAAAAFDIDKDAGGLPSILLLDGRAGQLQILKAGADKTYRFVKEINVGKWSAAPHLKMIFAPLMGNGTENILLFDSEKFAIMTPASSSHHRMEQQFSYETKIKEGVYGNITSGDINADGRPEIIMVEYNNNHIEILAIGPDGKPVPAMRFKIFEQKNYREAKQNKTDVEPRELEVSDVTGDGKDDLVTVIHDRLIIYPQD